jgi:hypothetical protein
MGNVGLFVLAWSISGQARISLPQLMFSGDVAPPALLASLALREHYP